jgi:hypothetical protein
MPLCYQRADAFCFPSPLVPAVTELLHPIDVGRKEFLPLLFCAARQPPDACGILTRPLVLQNVVPAVC